jgi:hypothetical protein
MKTSKAGRAALADGKAGAVAARGCPRSLRARGLWQIGNDSEWNFWYGGWRCRDFTKMFFMAEVRDSI